MCALSANRAIKSPPGDPGEPPAAIGRPLPEMEHWLSPPAGRRVVNALTIDVDDWPVAVLGPHHDISGRVIDNTRRLLHILAWHQVRATFFVLTRVAERFPDLVRDIHRAGHEIASHGHGHEQITTLSPHGFERDVRRSIDILTEITGERPLGYRAPAFSIVRETRWAGPILARLGLRYSSSIFPIAHPRYGIPDAPRHPHRWSDCDLIECPPATLHLLGRNWPIAGGGYFRLLPGPLARWAISRVNRENLVAVLYVHPYELDVRGIAAHREAGIKVPLMRHIHQALFRKRIEPRLNRLLERFSFAPLRELLAAAL